jgi:hypothetical protein
VLDVSDDGAKLLQMEAFDLALDGEFRSGIAATTSVIALPLGLPCPEGRP